MAELLVSDHVQRAQSALARSSIAGLRRIRVDSLHDAVVLKGRVGSFYHKQLAQELVRMEVDGAHVVNALQVVYAPPHDSPFAAW